MSVESETTTTEEKKPVVEDVKETTVAETTPETKESETTETEAKPGDEEKTTEEAAEAEKPEEKKETHLVRRLYKFMDKAAKAEAELNALKAQMGQQQPVQQQAPDRKQFANDADYLSAAVKFEVARQMPLQMQAPTAKASVEDVKKAYTDYAEVMEEADQVTIPDTVVPTVTQSPVFEHLRYYLTKHPDEAKALYQMPTVRAQAAIGKIEAKIEQDIESKAKPVVQTSKARPPITPVKLSGSTGKIDPDKLSDAEWFRVEKQRQLDKSRKR
jgi:hypothetical protein